MACIRIFIGIAIVAAVCGQTLATEFVVGDEIGWTTNFDYQAWAQGKEFHVGDKLIFNYPQGAHNVHKVDGTAFKLCAPPQTSVPLTTGSDVVTLQTAGRKWYICGVGSHCDTGMQKLLITVLPQMEMGSPTTSPPPTSAAGGLAPSAYFAWIVAGFGVFKLIMV